jgi:hypothetical protein
MKHKTSYQTNPTATVNNIVEISSWANRDLFDTLGSTYQNQKQILLNHIVPNTKSQAQQFLPLVLTITTCNGCFSDMPGFIKGLSVSPDACCFNSCNYRLNINQSDIVQKNYSNKHHISN